MPMRAASLLPTVRELGAGTMTLSTLQPSIFQDGLGWMWPPIQHNGMPKKMHLWRAWYLEQSLEYVSPSFVTSALRTELRLDRA